MKVKVINFDDFSDWCWENNLNIGTQELTDEQFNEIYSKSGTDWEFNSLEAFACEFNADGPYAPTPTNNLIRFFPNE